MVIGLDKTYKSNLVIELFHVQSGRRYSVVTQSIDKEFGLFFQNSLSEGKYLMTKINFKTEAMAGNSTYWFDLRDYPLLSFNIEKDKVNNIGEIEIDYYKKTFQNRYHGQYTITSESKREYNKGYLTVEEWFKEKYRGSLWNELAWIGTQLTER